MNETNEFRGERLKVKWLYVLILFFTLFLLIAAPATRKTVKEGNDYSDKESVALYLYTYKKLPGNYIYNEKKSNGKTDGKQPRDGKYYYQEHEYKDKIEKYAKDNGLSDLKNKNLFECDLSYPAGKENRGVLRLVYTEDCKQIFYTGTHYGEEGSPAFETLTKWSLNRTSNILWVLFAVTAGCEAGYVAIRLCAVNKGREDCVADLKSATEIFVTAVLCVVMFIPVLLISAVRSVMKKTGKSGTHKADGGS